MACCGRAAPQIRQSGLRSITLFSICRMPSRCWFAAYLSEPTQRSDRCRDADWRDAVCSDWPSVGAVTLSCPMATEATLLARGVRLPRHQPRPERLSVGVRAGAGGAPGQPTSSGGRRCRGGAAMTFETRRIFKSAVTSQNLIRELLQLMFLGELLAPGGERAWLVSPWISNIVLFDNSRGRFQLGQSRMGQSRDPAGRSGRSTSWRAAPPSGSRPASISIRFADRSAPRCG